MKKIFLLSILSCLFFGAINAQTIYPIKKLGTSYVLFADSLNETSDTVYARFYFDESVDVFTQFYGINTSADDSAAGNVAITRSEKLVDASFVTFKTLTTTVSAPTASYDTIGSATYMRFINTSTDTCQFGLIIKPLKRNN
jgi:hypothetical protein